MTGIYEVMQREWALYLTKITDGELWDQVIDPEVNDEDRATVLRELHRRHLARGEGRRTLSTAGSM